MEKYLIIKNIFNKINIHPFFCLIIIISVFTGNFNKFILFISIILFHELGHILVSILFKWKIEKIVILPFGGLTIFNEDINRPIFEEFLVCIAGPLFQIIYHLILSNFIDISNLHYSLLLFNLLPIIPLDGSKLFNLLFNKFFSFYSSYILTIIISIIVIIFGYIMILYNWNLLLFLTILFLLFKTIKEFKMLNYLFNRFLLERYMKAFEFTKMRSIYGLNLKKMYRDYKHVFIYQKKSYTEREIIRKRFDLQGKVW